MHGGAQPRSLGAAQQASKDLRSSELGQAYGEADEGCRRDGVPKDPAAVMRNRVPGESRHECAVEGNSYHAADQRGDEQRKQKCIELKVQPEPTRGYDLTEQTSSSYEKGPEEAGDRCSHQTTEQGSGDTSTWR